MASMVERPPLRMQVIGVGVPGSSFASWLVDLESQGFMVELCDGPECLLRHLRESVVHMIILSTQHPAGDPDRLAGMLWNAPISTPMFVASPEPTPVTPAEWIAAGVQWVFSLTRPAAEIAPALRRIVDRSEHLRAAEATVKVLQSQITADRKRFQDLGRSFRELNHELTTPLTVIQGYCSNLADGISGPLTSEQQKVVERIHYACNMMYEVLGQLKKKVPRPESLEVRRQDPRISQRRQLRLPKVAAEVIALFERAYAAKGVELKLSTDPACHPVWADQARLSQLLVNLLGNALRHTAPGGKVVVTVSDSSAEMKDTCELSVADSGSGIPQEHLQHIFVAGWSSAVGDQKRSGLGLAICKEVAVEHRAKLTVESELNQGTTFRLTLPTDPRKKSRAAVVQLVEDVSLAGQLLMELYQRGTEIELESPTNMEELAQTLIRSGQATLVLGASEERLSRAIAFLREGKP